MDEPVASRGPLGPHRWWTAQAGLLVVVLALGTWGMGWAQSSSVQGGGRGAGVFIVLWMLAAPVVAWMGSAIVAIAGIFWHGIGLRQAQEARQGDPWSETLYRLERWHRVGLVASVVVAAVDGLILLGLATFVWAAGRTPSNMHGLG